MVDGHFETTRTIDDEVRHRCSFDDEFFDAWEDAWQHMVDEHGWDRVSWERRQEVVGLVESVARHALEKGEG